VADGRKEGIIDTLQMAMMIDSLEMLRASPAFTTAEFDTLTGWFTTFLGWLRTNPLGWGGSGDQQPRQLLRSADHALCDFSRRHRAR